MDPEDLALGSDVAASASAAERAAGTGERRVRVLGAIACKECRGSACVQVMCRGLVAARPRPGPREKLGVAKYLP